MANRPYNYNVCLITCCGVHKLILQRAKKVVSDSPGLVDFVIGLVNFILNLPDGQVKFLRNSNYRRTVKSILLIKKFLGLAEMTFGLVYAALSLPEWQAVKITFFAPCTLNPYLWFACLTQHFPGDKIT